MAINNEPTIQPETVTGIFTNYIAKVLPLAFDDSMSYYECLCALLEYINETVVPDLNNVNSGLGELQEFYEELQSYVNNYFDNLDVQEEINNKLDKMAEDGTFTELIGEYVNPIINIQNQNIANIQTQTNRIETKVDAVASGSPAGVYSTVSALTTADPDHNKIYIVSTDGHWYYYNGASWTDGGTYQSAGVANNSITMDQLSYYFKSDSDNLINDVNTLEDKVWSANQPVTSDQTTTNSTFVSYNAISVTPSQQLVFLHNDGSKMTGTIDQVLYYNEDGSYNTYGALNLTNTNPITIPADIYYIKITGKKTNRISQIKDYDSGDYNPFYEPYKYNPKFVMKSDVSYLENFNKVTLSWTDETYILANTSHARKGEAIHDQWSTLDSASDFIKVSKGDKIKIYNSYNVSSAGAVAYDQFKAYSETILTNSNETTIEYTVPEGVEYIRFTILTANKDLVQFFFTDLRYENLLSGDVINTIEDKTRIDLSNILTTYANTPTLTLIDDDCNINSIPTIKSICDLEEIKCTFGLITKDITNESLMTLLKSYQDDGFHITSHTDTHNRWYTATGDGDIFTLNECETDLIKSIIKMDKENFLDNRYIIAPGNSYTRTGIDSIIDKWANCFVANTYDKSYNNLYTPNRYNLARTMLNKTAHNLAYYQGWIDTAVRDKSWIILGTHSYNSSEFDSGLLVNILNYAKAQGMEIKTLNQAFKDRKMIYDMKDLFS